MTLKSKLISGLSVFSVSSVLFAAGCVGGGATSGVDELEAAVKPLTAEFTDPTGKVSTYATSGKLDTSNPFFASLGSNGRSCGSCHFAEDGWSLSAAHAQQIFAATQGTVPLFRAA